MSTILNLKPPVIGLSPMDGITDTAFRQITKKYGNPDIMFTEFVHVMGLALAGQNILHTFFYEEMERPIIAQIYGAGPEYFYHAAKVVCALGFDGVDINMGCPARNVASKGAGAALIKNPELAKKIFEETKRGVNDWVGNGKLTGLSAKSEKAVENLVENYRQRAARSLDSRLLTPDPFPFYSQRTANSSMGLQNLLGEKRYAISVSIKTRIGYDKPVTAEWVSFLSKLNPDWISIHGRTLKQMYTGEANWDELKIAVESTKIPVLVNGDVKSYEDIEKILMHTGAAGVLIGRGTLGNPFVFINPKIQIANSKQNQKSKVKGQKYSSKIKTNTINAHNSRLFTLDSTTNNNTTHYQLPTHGGPATDLLSIMLEHAALFIKYYPHPNAFVQMRKHFGWYCKGFEGAKEMREKLMKAGNVSDVVRMLAKTKNTF